MLVLLFLEDPPTCLRTPDQKAAFLVSGDRQNDGMHDPTAESHMWVPLEVDSFRLGWDEIVFAIAFPRIDHAELF